MLVGTNMNNCARTCLVHYSRFAIHSSWSEEDRIQTRRVRGGIRLFEKPAVVCGAASVLFAAKGVFCVSALERGSVGRYATRDGGSPFGHGHGNALGPGVCYVLCRCGEAAVLLPL